MRQRKCMTWRCLWQEDHQIARKGGTGSGCRWHCCHGATSSSPNFLLPPENCSSSANPALRLKCAEKGFTRERPSALCTEDAAKQQASLWWNFYENTILVNVRSLKFFSHCTIESHFCWNSPQTRAVMSQVFLWEMSKSDAHPTHTSDLYQVAPLLKQLRCDYFQTISLRGVGFSHCLFDPVLELPRSSISPRRLSPLSPDETVSYRCVLLVSSVSQGGHSQPTQKGIYGFFLFFKKKE